MNEKKYEKRLEFQKKMISRQSEQIDGLKSEIEKLKLECQKKDKIINSVSSLRSELVKDAEDVKQYKEEYRKLINELKNMKKILNQEVYKGRWWLIKFLIK